MIDTESKNFIKWAMTRLDDRDFYNSMVRKIQMQLNNYYRKSSRRVVLTHLKRKMELGAIHHGEPEKELKLLHEEINEELLDLIGWNMLILWSLNKKGVKA